MKSPRWKSAAFTLALGVAAGPLMARTPAQDDAVPQASPSAAPAGSATKAGATAEAPAAVPSAADAATQAPPAAPSSIAPSSVAPAPAASAASAASGSAPSADQTSAAAAPPPKTPVGEGALKGADLSVAAIEAAAPAADLAAASPAFLVKLSVWLDRAHNSPGEIDGRLGPNLKEALATYEGAHHLAGDGAMTGPALAALGADKAPITQTYQITEKDEAGPFIGHLPADFYAQSKLKRMGYLSPEQELAERFHMSMALLEAMNPGADFTKPGVSLEVLRVHVGGLGASVARIEVDKTASQVRALAADGSLVASFPATIGSADHPAPSGTLSVVGVRFDPVYVYDPRVLTWGPKARGRFSIKPGPNNPTGVVWIALSRPTFGIHGTPEAGLVGKTASHGCVRLTNWDAWDLGNAVEKGAKVVFMGERPTRG